MRRSSRIIWMAPQCKHTYPCEREADKHLTWTHRKEGDMKVRQRVKWPGQESRNTGDTRNQKRQRTDSSFEPPRECGPADTLISAQWHPFQTFRVHNCEGINFCCHKHEFMVICYKSHSKVKKSHNRSEWITSEDGRQDDINDILGDRLCNPILGQGKREQVT